MTVTHGCLEIRYTTASGKEASRTVRIDERLVKDPSMIVSPIVLQGKLTLQDIEREVRDA